ncbi:MAG TPA: DUF1801 domain-containing protein [Candidatus Binatia bacterium]|nr:DUF1801 domain-containing protein [Candidatus Binatia bacterium]
MRRTPDALRSFLAPYDASVARLFLAARKAVLEAAPDANELVYDAYNTVSDVFSFSDRLKDAFCHVAAYTSYVNLGFNRGATLPDPERRLAGSGAAIRHVRIDDARTLRDPAVRALVRAAAERARSSATPPARPQSIVKAVYPRKRRPGAARSAAESGSRTRRR